MNTFNSNRFKVNAYKINKINSKPLPVRNTYTLWDYIVEDIENKNKKFTKNETNETMS